MTSKLSLFLWLAFITVISESKKCQGPKYQCFEKSKSKNMTEQCTYEEIERIITKKQDLSDFCKPINAKVKYDVDENCKIFASVQFCHGTSCANKHKNDNITGFYVLLTIRNYEYYYKINLPSSYNKRTGGRFNFRFKNDVKVDDSYILEVSALPKSKYQISKFRNKLDNKLACELFEKQSCTKKKEDFFCHRFH